MDWSNLFLSDENEKWSAFVSQSGSQQRPLQSCSAVTCLAMPYHLNKLLMAIDKWSAWKISFGLAV